MDELPTVSTVYKQADDGSWYVNLTIHGLPNEAMASKALEMLHSYVCGAEIDSASGIQ